MQFFYLTLKPTILRVSSLCEIVDVFFVDVEMNRLLFQYPKLNCHFKPASFMSTARWKELEAFLSLKACGSYKLIHEMLQNTLQS